MSTTTPQSSREIEIGPLLISIAIPLVLGVIIGFVFTRPEIPGWYASINKPSFTPPSWVFGPVWSIMYILIGTAAYLVWQRRDDSLQFINTRMVYVIQLLFNFSWSYIFFKMHLILGGLIIIFILLFSILLTISMFYKYNKTAGRLLIPYLVWVSFATALNLGVFLLNK
ncbi:TspO/MBR family protein [Mucilaginibacter gynuensis]|uniref:TspO/MBR family protein n=1 Tax=Mucilaginibacter gynuensis TaxID=1302236 RepID=A0ABP8HNK1_9SPHI